MNENAATVLSAGSPIDAAKPVYSNLTSVTADGYNYGTGDMMQVGARPETATDVQVLVELHKVKVTKTDTTFQLIDTFDSGLQPCTGTWTNSPTNVFNIADTDV